MDVVLTLFFWLWTGICPLGRLEAHDQIGRVGMFERYRTDRSSQIFAIYSVLPNRSFFQEAPNSSRKPLFFVSEQILFPGSSQFWQKALNFCPEHVFCANHCAYKCSEQIIFAEGCPISRGNYFTEHVFCRFIEQIEQNFFEQISFTGSLKKQFVQQKLSVRTDRFYRMTNFWIILKNLIWKRP